MSDTKIAPCTCKSEYQDKLYGKGMRVHNHGDKLDTWTCTVCSPSSATRKRMRAVQDVELTAAKQRRG